MAIELRFTVPDWEAFQAVDAVMGLPIVIGEIETEYIGEGQEDHETGPSAAREVACSG